MIQPLSQKAREEKYRQKRKYLSASNLGDPFKGNLV
jgi:hypothetical protein